MLGNYLSFSFTEVWFSDLAIHDSLYFGKDLSLISASDYESCTYFRQKIHVPENDFLLEGYHQWLAESLQEAQNSSKSTESGNSDQKVLKEAWENGKPSVKSGYAFSNIICLLRSKILFV